MRHLWRIGAVLVLCLAWGALYYSLSRHDPREIFSAATNGLAGEAAAVLRQHPGAATLPDRGGTLMYVRGRKEYLWVPRAPWPALMRAARYGQLRVVKELDRAGAPLDFHDANGLTPLHLAAGSGQMALIKMLTSPATVKARAWSGFFAGQTPLHFAARLGRLPAVKHLVSQGADPRAKDAAGRTPADLARAAGYWAVSNYLDGPKGG